MAWVGALKRRIYRSPWIKTSISVSTAMLGGIFSNTLVTEMSSPSGIDWTSFYTTTSFWPLLVVCAVTLIFYRFLHSYDIEISAFKDAEFCMAYARSHLIPAQVQAAMDAIDRGETAQFNAAMKQIKDALK